MNGNKAQNQISASAFDANGFVLQKFVLIRKLSNPCRKAIFPVGFLNYDNGKDRDLVKGYALCYSDMHL